MAWIESHQNLGTHRKLMSLCRELNISDAEAVGHLHYLWWWCLDNAPDGNITDIPYEVLAEVAHWTNTGKGRKKDPILFINALINCQFIDNYQELNGKSKLYLHNWSDYAGKLIDRRKANTERVRQHRNALRNANVTVTSPLRNGATVPNSTVPNSTSVSDKSANNLKKDTEIYLPKLSNHPLIAQMQEHLGYPTLADKDPVPNPAKEGNFIRKMMSRGFSESDIMSLWRAKVKAKNNNFVSMQWVNEDIGKSNGTGKSHNKMIQPENFDSHVCSTPEDLQRIRSLRQERTTNEGP